MPHICHPLLDVGEALLKQGLDGLTAGGRPVSEME